MLKLIFDVIIAKATVNYILESTGIAERDRQERQRRDQQHLQQWCEERKREEIAASEKRKAAWLAKYPNYVTKKEVKSTPMPVTQVKSTSMTDQQFYDRFGIWPDEMGEHPYNPPTR